MQHFVVVEFHLFLSGWKENSLFKLLCRGCVCVIIKMCACTVNNKKQGLDMFTNELMRNTVVLFTCALCHSRWLSLTIYMRCYPIRSPDAFYQNKFVMCTFSCIFLPQFFIISKWWFVITLAVGIRFILKKQWHDCNRLSASFL